MQILTHNYTDRLLFLRMCFEKAKECTNKGNYYSILHIIFIYFVLIIQGEQRCYVILDKDFPTDVDGSKPSELELVQPRNDGTYSNCCEGTVTSETRVFDNGYPWVLPIFFGNLTTACNMLTGPQDIPIVLSLTDTRYNVGGLTFWNGSHYIARLHHNGTWFDYDGLATPPLQPINGLLAPVRVGYMMSSAAYFVTKSNR